MAWWTLNIWLLYSNENLPKSIQFGQIPNKLFKIAKELLTVCQSGEFLLNVVKLVIYHGNTGQILNKPYKITKDL